LQVELENLDCGSTSLSRRYSTAINAKALYPVKIALWFSTIEEKDRFINGRPYLLYIF
jgi:hypothetical protein